VIGHIVSVDEANNEPSVVTRTAPGRRLVVTDRLGFPNNAAKKQKTTNALPAVSDKFLTSFNFSMSTISNCNAFIFHSHTFKIRIHTLPMRTLNNRMSP
jgi:hypothetical protein